ncbi:hypothetical protein HELRODRAFT_87531 [Helobdella robusta]|uniref:Uncharacterized protein n=1 Tax=Helobdella robusta TaxID=6412 RepID=T1G6R6_HELRO|nr:hypothetical protein HELRODRAFT_87531 [Helobdella robusta]ESN94772.1 hypothetical protein HELRODRAFT_87531 [Helobdella robusta]
MVSYASAMLDELMGRNRNSDPNEKPKDLNWADTEVCKYHLCSFCPHELFTNTRADLGLCNKIHDDELARNYRKSSKFMKMGYEEEFLFYLESLVSEVDRRIKRGHARLALNAAHQAQQLQGITDAQDERIKQLTIKINEAIEKVESLGCEGKVEEAQQLMKQCDQMKEERRLLEEFKTNYAIKPLNLNNSHKEMEVCPICGAFLVVGDAIQRVEEHLQGKQHLGYARVRETIENLRVSKLSC